MTSIHPSTARVRDIFDDWARSGRAEGMETGHGPSARAGIERLALGQGDGYLDIGCGNGYTLRWVSAVVGTAGRAIGIDVAPGMVERARALSSTFSVRTSRSWPSIRSPMSPRTRPNGWNSTYGMSLAAGV